MFIMCLSVAFTLTFQQFANYVWLHLLNQTGKVQENTVVITVLNNIDLIVEDVCLICLITAIKHQEDK